MTISRLTMDVLTHASGCSLWVCDNTPRNLDAAAKADNAASALLRLRAARAEVGMLQARIVDAIAACENEMRGDEDTPFRPLFDALEKATAPKPHLRIVG